MSDPNASRKHSPYEAFSHRSYLLYTVGSTLVHVGAAAQAVAVALEVHARVGGDLQDKSLYLGLVALMGAIPMLVGTLPAGFLADHFDRKRLTMFSMLGATLTSFLLMVVSYCQGPLYLLYLLLLLDATALTLGRPARAAMAPMLVPAEILENAMKWRSTMFQLAAAIGPAVGGFVAAWHLPATYIFAGCSSIVFLLLLPKIRLPEVRRAKTGMSLKNVASGARFIFRNRIILAAISLDLFAVLLGGAVALLPIFAKDILQVGDVGLGWLRAGPAIGALSMGLILAHMPPMKHAGRNMLLAVAGFGAATVVFGFSQNYWLSLAMLILTGALDNISVVVRHTLIQLLTPDEMRGRVSAANTIFIGSSNELGGFESGALARLTSPVFSVVFGGIGSIVVVAVTTAWSKGLRRVGRLEDVRPILEQTDELPGGEPGQRKLP
jgi:MFS family permease